MKTDVVAQFKDNPGQWATVAKNVSSAQSVAQWVDRQNGRDKDGNKNDGPWEYTAIASGETATDKDGKKVKNGKGEEVKGYNVSVCYNPEGIKWT
ncbi:hypothetical protein [Nocardioides flavus (ex Wang et al. 2016)]|nr:hypothetical protein [Nocardioides flavus (ex Wang et al. 2016)]